MYVTRPSVSACWPASRTAHRRAATAVGARWPPHCRGWWGWGAIVKTCGWRSLGGFGLDGFFGSFDELAVDDRGSGADERDLSGSKSWPWCLTCGFKLRGASWLSSRGIRSRIWTCQPVTWTSSTMRRSRACFWSKSSVSITAMTRVAKSRTRGWCAHFRPGVQRNLRLPERLHLGPGHRMVAPANTAGSPGNNSAAATAPADGGRAQPIGCCSTRRRCPPRATDTGRSDPRCVAGHRMRTTPAETGLVERLLLGDGHGGCGRRLGETHRWKHRQGAPGRPRRPATRAPSATEPARRGRARLRVPARTRRRHRHHLRRDRRA